MANFEALKTLIRQYIKENGDGEITGDILQSVLIAIVTEVEGNGYVYAGIATPTTEPVTGNVFYIATEAGSYSNFGSVDVSAGITILKRDGTSWTKNQISYTDGVFDISAYNGSSYADLAAALGTNGANVPVSVRKGGMSVKFVSTSDNKYVQFRYIGSSTAAADFTNVVNWQSMNVDDVPAYNSENLSKSKDVYSLGLEVLNLYKEQNAEYTEITGLMIDSDGTIYVPEVSQAQLNKAKIWYIPVEKGNIFNIHAILAVPQIGVRWGLYNNIPTEGSATTIAGRIAPNDNNVDGSVIVPQDGYLAFNYWSDNFSSVRLTENVLKIDTDETPNAGSKKPIESGGVYPIEIAQEIDNLVARKTITTNAGGVDKEFINETSCEAGKYYVMIDGLTNNKYINLYIGSTRVQENAAIVTPTKNIVLFTANQDFTAIKIWSPNAESIDVSLYTHTDEYIGERVGKVETKLGYYVCNTNGNAAEKVISDATGYVLSTGGSMKVKMTNANTADNATLNINSTGAKALYYAGERVSSVNTWKAGETVEVYYDGTSYYANSVDIWQHVDDEPTAGSKNFVKSGGVYPIKASQGLKELIAHNAVTTTAGGGGGGTFVFQDIAGGAGKYFIRIDGLTKAKAVNLFYGSTMVQEDAVFLSLNKNAAIFTANQAFTAVKIWSPNAETIDVSLYSYTDEYIGERVGILEALAAEDANLISILNFPSFRLRENTQESFITGSFTTNKDYSIKIKGNSHIVNVSLYNGSTLVKSNIVSINAGGGMRTFKSDAAFDTIKLIDTNLEIVDVVLYEVDNSETVSDRVDGLESYVGALKYIVNDKPFDTSYYSLIAGNLNNGQPEYNYPQVRTSCFYPILSDKVKLVSDSWNFAILYYETAEFNTYISNSVVNAGVEKTVEVPSNAKYYMLLFWGSSAPTVNDILNDGAIVEFITKPKEYAEETRLLYDSLSTYVTSSNLDARKHYTKRSIIIKPTLNLNRENGNIIWNGDKRLCQNPLTEVSTPDPTVVKMGDYYYMAHTDFPIKIYRSIDMVNWEFYRNVFTGTNNDPFNTGATDPFNMGSTNLAYWAPSIFVYDGKVCIYSYTIDANDFSIAATQLFQADDIDSAFSWSGTVHQEGLSNEVFRDTQHFEDTNGDIYISTGDRSSGDYGEKRIALMDSDLITVVDSWRISNISYSAEGTLLFKRNGWYYLFYSDGGASGTSYDVECKRSRDITAANWEDLGVLLRQEDATNPLNSTGHVGEIMEDNNGKLFVFMHCHCYGLTPNDSAGYGKRYLYMNQIIFDDNDIPHFVDKDGNVITEPQWFTKCPNI